ncbi:MAG: glucose-1-phosphate cytidylyltransferase [Kofleriaceae bacterium]
MTMPVVILCGGQGTRLREATETRPKPMVEIGGRPLLWHLMSFYAGYGYKDFVLCLGYMGDVIKRYFLDFAAMSSDFTIDLSGPDRLELHQGGGRDWRVTCVDTGAHAMTGARLARVARYLRGDQFMLTYGDGLSDVDVPRLVAFHRAHGKLATVTGVRPPGRFGELTIDGAAVKSFVEKPAARDAHGVINGGFFVLDRKVLDYVTDDDACMFEREPLEHLARDGQLMVHHHHGFWQCMDTYRDLMALEQVWTTGRVPWRTL